MRHLSNEELYKEMQGETCPECNSSDRTTMDTTIDEVVICNGCQTHIKIMHDQKIAIILNGV